MKTFIYIKLIKNHIITSKKSYHGKNWVTKKNKDKSCHNKNVSQGCDKIWE